MKKSNQPQNAKRGDKGLKGILKGGVRTLPMLGAAVLFGMATPVLADTKVSFHVGHDRAHQGHSVERKLNRVVRKVARELNGLQPVSHRDARRADRRADRRAHRRADRYRHDRHQRNARYYDSYYADPLYRPMSFKRWSRYHWRATGSERHITERNYRRYLKKYRKHYRHGHEQPYWAGVDRKRRGYNGRR